MNNLSCQNSSRHGRHTHIEKILAARYAVLADHASYLAEADAKSVTLGPTLHRDSIAVVEHHARVAVGQFDRTLTIPSQL